MLGEQYFLIMIIHGKESKVLETSELQSTAKKLFVYCSVLKISKLEDLTRFFSQIVSHPSYFGIIENTGVVFQFFVVYFRIVWVSMGTRKIRRG